MTLERNARSSVRLPLAALLGTLMLTAACGGNPDDPDMTLVVTFDGLSCRSAGVDRVRVDFIGAGISTDEACPRSGDIEVFIPNLDPRTYRVRFEGVDRSGLVAYQDTFDIRHTRGGSHVYDIDVRSVTEVVTRFTFAGTDAQDGLTCDESAITRLNLTIGSTEFRDVPCRASGQDAAAFTGIAPGRQDISIEAFDRGGRRLYASSFSGIDIRRGSNEFVLNLLPLQKGGLSFEWRFGNGLTCAQAGVATVEYALVDALGRLVFDETRACSDVPVTFAHDVSASALNAGLYSIAYLRGISAGGSKRYERTSIPLYAPAGRTADFGAIQVPSR